MIPMTVPGLNIESDENMDFFEYGESIGFFDNLQMVLPPNFHKLFEIARTIFTEETTSEALSAIEDITKEEKIYEPDRDENIQINRMDKIAPVGNKMEIDFFRTINDLKKALPRELAHDDDILNAKLFTKTLLIQRQYESEADSFKPISTSRDEAGKDANKFEQKFFILLDRSRSMDLKLRSYYSKCIVVEFLRRKLNSKAKLYYRAFDSKVGKLYKIEKREDFPILIENVLLTTTGGKSTNLQDAVFQAIKDIEYDKEMLNSEIVVVTDGVSKIDSHEMQKRLGDIKLNVLKIGDEMAEPDYYEMKQNLDQENVDFDPTSVNLKNIQKEISTYNPDDDENDIPLSKQRVYRLLLDYSDSLFKDLKEVSKKYIEIGDLPHDGSFEPTGEQVEKIQDFVENFRKIDFSEKDIDDLKKLYKQVYFFSQYIEQLIQMEGPHNAALKKCLENLLDVKQKMLKNPELLFTVMQVKELDDDKKLMKLAKKDARKMMKEMQLDNKKLTIKEMKKAQMLFTFDVGEGSMGQFILLLIIKLMQLLKRIFLFPANLFKKKDS